MDARRDGAGQVARELCAPCAPDLPTSTTRSRSSRGGAGDRSHVDLKMARSAERRS